MACGDGVGSAECARAHLHSRNEELVVMCGGRTAISRSLEKKKKPRLVVEQEDQQPPKAASKSLRTSRYGRRQQ